MSVPRESIEVGEAYRNGAGGMFRVLMRHGQKLTVSGPDGKVSEVSLGRFAAQMDGRAYGASSAKDPA